MAILPNQRHPILIIQCDDADSSRMLEILTLDQRPVRRPYLILHIAGDLAACQHRGRVDRPAEWLIGQLPGTKNDHRWSLSTGSRVATLRSSAASTRPTKRGCGLVGRDFSSGCACVATQ